MKTELLDFEYPEELVATHPQSPSRILFSAPNQIPVELSKKELFSKIGPNDVVIINDTKVEKRRVVANDGTEVLFVNQLDTKLWQVLFPARNFKVGDPLELPGELTLFVKEKGIPQTVELNRSIDESYFQDSGVFALPPYIQKQRRNTGFADAKDEEWYQTEWAKNSGSCAAPTASLHFSNEDWDLLRSWGIPVEPVTLHVGMGTFLPIKAEKVQDHEMHSEWVSIPKQTLDIIAERKGQGGKVWALGTTVVRTLESWSKGLLQENSDGSVSGTTDIFIKPGFKYEVVGVLMTNFHQPKSTLVALVAAFAGLFRTKEVYEWAILNKFRLFSYGDLSVWFPE